LCPNRAKLSTARTDEIDVNGGSANRRIGGTRLV